LVVVVVVVVRERERVLGYDWFHLVQDRDQWRALMNTVATFEFSEMLGTLSAWQLVKMDSTPWNLLLLRGNVTNAFSLCIPLCRFFAESIQKPTVLYNGLIWSNKMDSSGASYRSCELQLVPSSPSDHIAVSPTMKQPENIAHCITVIASFLLVITADFKVVERLYRIIVYWNI
jgi:hypothetical protein